MSIVYFHSINNNMTVLKTNDILTHVFRNYPLQPFLYRVYINGGGPVPDANSDIMLNCTSIMVPGENMGVNFVKRHGIGRPTNIATGKSFTEVTLDFMEADGSPEKKYFSDWQKQMFNPVTQRIGFYKDYTKTILIDQYDRSGNITFQGKLIECFPSNITPVSRGYDMTNPSTVTVSFQIYNVEEMYFNKERGVNPFGFI